MSGFFSKVKASLDTSCPKAPKAHAAEKESSIDKFLKSASASASSSASQGGKPESASQGGKPETGKDCKELSSALKDGKPKATGDEPKSPHKRQTADEIVQEEITSIFHGTDKYNKATISSYLSAAYSKSPGVLTSRFLICNLSLHFPKPPARPRPRPPAPVGDEATGINSGETELEGSIQGR